MFNLKINFKTEDTPVIIKDLENFFTNFSIVQQPNKNIKTIEFISNDGKTIYQRINPNLESNKYYNINQFVKIV